MSKHSENMEDDDGSEHQNQNIIEADNEVVQTLQENHLEDEEYETAAVDQDQ